MKIFESTNPYNQEVVGETPGHDSQEIEQILKKSAKGAALWKNTPKTARRQVLHKMAGVLEKNKEKYARTISLEMGKTFQEATAEVSKCAWVCEYYAENGIGFLEDEQIATDAQESFVRYDPIGTVLSIMPWNFPFWQFFRFACPSLMAGNAILLKHAPNVFLSAKNLVEILKESGLPEDVCQNLFIDVESVEEIIASRYVQAVTVTGSVNAGRAVAAIAGKNLKKTVLELGGNNAFVLLEDSKLDEAVDVAFKARMQNAGQSCIAAKRFLVSEKMAHEFIERLAAKISEVALGDPLDETTTMGPLARIDLADKVSEQVQVSVERGAQLLMGAEQDKAFITPGILTDVEPGMPAFDEEVFGPVAAVTTYQTEEEAIRLANTSPYGLGTTLFTSDVERVRKYVSQLDDGAVFINQLVKSDPRLPFGGTKNSGYGRELSRHGIREFVNAKTVYLK